MSAEIIPFPEPRSYVDYCPSPEKRDIARRMYKQLAEDMPWWERFRAMTGVDPMACPCCGGRLLRRPALFEELQRPVDSPARAPPVAA